MASSVVDSNLVYHMSNAHNGHHTVREAAPIRSSKIVLAWEKTDWRIFMKCLKSSSRQQVSLFANTHNSKFSIPHVVMKLRSCRVVRDNKSSCRKPFPWKMRLRFTCVSKNNLTALHERFSGGIGRATSSHWAARARGPTKPSLRVTPCNYSWCELSYRW